MPLGMACAARVAALVRVVMARYRGVFFVMLNLAFSMILYAALLKLYWVTGGTDGIGVRTPTFLGFMPPRAPAFGEKLAGTIQELRRAPLSVLMAESDLKRISFSETIYTIERGEIIQPAHQ